MGLLDGDVLEMNLVNGRVFELECYGTELSQTKLDVMGQEIAKAFVVTGRLKVEDIVIEVQDQHDIGELEGFTQRLESRDEGVNNLLVMNYRGIRVRINPAVPLTELWFTYASQGDRLGVITNLKPKFKRLLH